MHLEDEQNSVSTSISSPSSLNLRLCTHLICRSMFELVANVVGHKLHFITGLLIFPLLNRLIYLSTNSKKILARPNVVLASVSPLPASVWAKNVPTFPSFDVPGFWFDSYALKNTKDENIFQKMRSTHKSICVDWKKMEYTHFIYGRFCTPPTFYQHMPNER